MQFSEVEKVLRDIVEQNFLHQTVEKQYLNEAQAQYKLAIALYEKGAKDITVEWAVRDSDKNKFIDLAFKTDDGKRVAVELKYKTKKVDIDEFLYANQGTPYSGRFGFLKDIKRLEQLKDESRSEYRIDMGFAILITNDHLCWQKPRAGAQGEKVDLGEKISKEKVYEYNKSQER